MATSQEAMNLKLYIERLVNFMRFKRTNSLTRNYKRSLPYVPLIAQIIGFINNMEAREVNFSFTDIVNIHDRLTDDSVLSIEELKHFVISLNNDIKDLEVSSKNINYQSFSGGGAGPSSMSGIPSYGTSFNPFNPPFQFKRTRKSVKKSTKRTRKSVKKSTKRTRK